MRVEIREKWKEVISEFVLGGSTGSSFNQQTSTLEHFSIHPSTSSSPRLIVKKSSTFFYFVLADKSCNGVWRGWVKRAKVGGCCFLSKEVSFQRVPSTDEPVSDKGVSKWGKSGDGDYSGSLITTFLKKVDFLIEVVTILKNNFKQEANVWLISKIIFIHKINFSCPCTISFHNLRCER